MSTLSMPVNGAGRAELVGNDRLLAGLVLGVMSFWLFAQTVMNIAPVLQADLGLATAAMNTAVALTSLFAGIFVVVMGGLADRVGRVRITRLGFLLGIAGSLLVALTPQGALAAPVLLAGRALQGLSAACIMPASLALLKAGWDGAGRQRAISIWSIGTWGGAGPRPGARRPPPGRAGRDRLHGRDAVAAGAGDPGRWSGSPAARTTWPCARPHSWPWPATWPWCWRRSWRWSPPSRPPRRRTQAAVSWARNISSVATSSSTK